MRDALVRQLENAGAVLRAGIAVRDVRSATESRWEVVTDEDTLPCNNVLLCSGGLSYPGCGTTGDGYQWARRVGHSIVPTFPALAPLVSPVNWVHELTGITLPDVSVRINTSNTKDKDPRRSCRSSFLWTHFGCSGPAPMNVSRFVAAHQQARLADSNLGPAVLEIDLIPDVSEAELSDRFDPGKNGRRRISGLLGHGFPTSWSIGCCSMPGWMKSSGGSRTSQESEATIAV